MKIKEIEGTIRNKGTENTVTTREMCDYHFI